MDLPGAIQSNCTGKLRFMVLKSSITEKPIVSGYLKNMVVATGLLSVSSYRVESSEIFRIKLPKGGAFSPSGFSRSFVIRATGKHDDSFAEDNGSNEINPFSENNTKRDGGQNSYHKSIDWRDFRASLYIQEQAAIAISDPQKRDGTAFGFKSLPPKWAHPIAAPENGCLLVSTEKLDSVRSFERTVVLLLRTGTNRPQEGPFGLIINRPLGKKMKHMKPTNLDLATTFSDCSLHFGGPLDASMILLRAEGNYERIQGFNEVIPGVSFGSRNCLEEASALVKKGELKPQNFRFFLGYAGWQLDQLMEELELGYWCVAACSANLIFGSSPSESLWEEILQLMGGDYSEISRKPRKDI
ncbi:unnamed protein product [Cuscuta epithymum]|uniref:Uncharacterized protein n=2 Tax=Cuscuta epithymum TaxID=186058 RepID=A0AAV0E0I3_9ASTE|nr:unnamed protein product [Cuscuta epithymum]CAH9126701.1 unnamed protein product [Cuscuta epithymum]